MRFSVIVPTLGRRDVLSETLASILACDPPPDETIVVDGDPEGSGSPVVEEAQRAFPERRLVHLPAPKGLTIQRNAGLAVAAGDVVVFTDDDVVVSPDAFAQLGRVYADPSIVGATGRVIEPADRRIGGKGSRLRRWLPGGGPEGSFTRYGYPRRVTDEHHARDVEYMPGCFMTARRAVATELGFDESMAGYALAEDEDFAYRLSRAGRIRYEPAIVVHHKNTGFATRDRRAFNRMVVVNRSYLFRKNFRRSLLAKAQFVLLIVILFVHRAIDRDAAGLRGLLEGSIEAWRTR